MIIQELMFKVGLITEKDLADGGKAFQKGLEKMERAAKKAGRDLTEAITIPIAGIATAAFASSDDARKTFEIFGARVKTTFGRLGTDLSRALNLDRILTNLAGLLRDTVDWFRRLDDSTKRVIVTMAGIVALLGPALLLFSKLVGAVGALVGAFTTLKLALIAIGVANPVGWITLAIAGLAAGAVGLSSFLGKQKEVKKEMADTSTVADRLAESARKTGEAVRAMSGLGSGTAGSDRTLRTWNIIPQDTRSRLQKDGMSAGRGAPRPVYIEEQGPLLEDRARAMQMRDPLEKTPLPTPDYLIEGTQAWEAYTGATMKAHDGLTMIEKRLQMGEIFDSAAAKADVFKQKMETIGGIPGGFESEQFKNAALNIQIQNQAMIEQASRAYTLAGAWDAVKIQLLSIPSLASQVGGAFKQTFDQLSAGVGNALGQLLVYGGSFSKVMKELLKQVLASVISTFVQIAIQQLIGIIAAKVFAAAVGSANIGVSVARAGAAAYAAAVESQGLIGLGTGAGFAATAIAGAAAAASTGKAVGAGIGFAAGGLAEGGFAMRPTYRLFGEAGPEAVLPLSPDRIRKYFGRALGGRGGDLHVHLDADGRELAHIVIPHFKDELEFQGA